MAVLAVIALTSITIGALFGMLLTTMRITAMQERTAREARAADGAVTATINHLRLNQAVSGADACLPAVPAAGIQVPFDSISGAGDVKVTCTRATDDLGAPGGELKLVGSDAAGAINWKAWPQWPSVPVDVSSAKATLVHQGGQALEFNGNVSSVAGAAAVRTDTGATPAIKVRGKYSQSGAGLGATTGCGVLSGPSAKPSTTVFASAGVSCGDPNLVPVAVTQDYAIDTSTPTGLPLPTACPASKVISLSPGRYDQVAVATLNKWFSRTGGCTDKTFHFAQGRYWFDANTAGASAADRHALIFDNPTSSFVFGTSSGWSIDPATGGAPASAFPNACSAQAIAGSGASIILSARTEFRHLAGRLAVCPFVSAGNVRYPTLLQQTTVPTTVTVTNPQSTTFLPPANLISGSASAAAGPVPFTCPFPPQGTNIVFCNSTRTFSFVLSSQYDGALSGASVRLTGNEVNNNVNAVSSRKVNLAVTLASGATCTTTEADGLPDKGRTTVYPLTTGTCAGVVTAGADLDGAVVQASIVYRYQGICASLAPCPLPASAAQNLAIWNIEVSASPWVGTMASAAGSPTDGWTTVDNIRLDDTAKAGLVACPGADVFCPLPSSTTLVRTLQTGAYDDSPSGATLPPDSHVDSFGVLLRQQVPANNGVQTGFNLATLPGQTTMTVTLRDGTVCTTTVSGVPNLSGDTYFPLLRAGDSGCGSTSLGAAKQVGSNLLGATVTAQFQLTCAVVGSPNCLFYDPVPLQFLGLVATTDTYAGPVVKSQLTIDSANGASANFFGPAYLKHTALDLHWNGARSGASLFGGEVQLFSLGSVMAANATADVVCCTAPEIASRKVRVTAWIDNRPKLSVVVELDRVGGRPSVLDWSVCGRNDNCPASP